MLELIGIPKTKTKKKIERIFQTENSFIAERKKEKNRKNESEGKNYNRRKE